MVNTIKFSEMNPGGDIANDDKTPGLLSGANVLFNNPWTFLPPGSTADRPAPSAAINYRLRFNTDDQLYEYYDAVLGIWTQLQESAFTVGPFVIYEADPFLPDAQNLGALADGILKQTISSGVATLDIAVNGVDFYGPGFTGYFQSPAGVKDVNGNIVVQFGGVASAVNYLNINNNITGNAPFLNVLGSDPSIGMAFGAKGDAGFNFVSSAVALPPFAIASGTLSQHVTNFLFFNTAATRNVTFPDASGTVAFTSDIPDTYQTIVTTGGNTIFTATSPKITVFTGTSTQTVTMPDVTTLALGQKFLIINDSSQPITVNSSGGNLIETMLTVASINVMCISLSGTTASSWQLIPMYSSINGNASINQLVFGSLRASTNGAPIVSQDGFSTIGILNSGGTSVNFLSISANITGSDPVITMGSSSDPNSGLEILAKGSGQFHVNTLSNTPIYFLSGTAYQHQSNFTFANTAANRTYTFQDASGTLAFLTDIPSGSPSALTKTDDTNVTLTLGGTPATALLQAVSLTLGWTGTLSGTRGGTGVNNGASTITLGGSLTTSGAFASIFTMTGITSVTFPTTGTLATTSQLVTPAALTKTDDTNVTLTLGGSPTTALVNAASLTLGWTGQLSLARGGTNNSLTASAGGIVWSDSTKLNILSGTSTANQILLSGNAATPAWSTTTYPATNAINTIMYASSANVLGVITPVNSAVLISSSGGVPSMSTTLPSGIAATNMNLTTPTLGVASATSINFGGSTLSNYVSNTAWTPVFTFATPGDVSVAYATQSGVYTRIGSVVFFTLSVTCTPTFTTSSGAITITGLPLQVNGTFTAPHFVIFSTAGVTFPAGKTFPTALPVLNTTTIIFQAGGSATAIASIAAANIVSGVQIGMVASGFYFT